SYLIAPLNFPLVDEQLIAVDHMFFFDWKSYITWVNDHPTLALILGQAYLSSGPQILTIFLILFMYHYTARVQRFMFAFFCSAYLVVIFSAFFPAMGGYEHYHIDMSLYPNLHPGGSEGHVQGLLPLR